MSNELFDRSVEVSIGKRGKNGTLYNNLRISFKVEKTLESKPNKGEVRVYNLNKDSRSKAEQTGNVIILKAGYGTQIESIFTGDVARAQTEFDGTDYVTIFELGDGELLYSTAKSEISFSKGTDLKSAVEKILSNSGAILGDITGLKSEKLLSGLVLSGNVRKHLDDLSERQGFEWSIQDDKVQILTKGNSTKEEAILLSPSTGLVGMPKARFGKVKGDRGIEFSALLNGKLKAGRTVVIESKVFQGKYRLEKIVHTGDNFGADWLSKCEAVPL